MLTTARSASIKGRLVSATLSNYAGRLVTMGAWFLLTPVLLHQLGPTQYGLWVLVGSLVAYGWLLNAGIQGAITRYVAACHVTGELDLASRIVTTSLWCDTFLGMLAIGSSALLAPLVPVIFQIPPEEHASATWLVLLMGVGIGITIPCETGAAVLRGLHRYDLANLVQVVSTLLNVGAIAVILLVGGGLLGVVAVTPPATLLSQVLSMRLAGHVEPGLRFHWRSFDPALVRRIVGFSWPLLLGQTAALIQRKSDEIVIALFLPVAFVAPYALAHRLSDVCRELSKQFMGPFLPLASELDAQHATERLRSLYVSGTRLALAIYLPIACTVTLLAHPILRLWVGEAYTGNVVVVAILSLAGALISTEWLATAVLQGLGRHRRQGVVALCSALGNVLISAALLNVMGLNGVALGTLISAGVEFVIVMPYAARVIGVTLEDAIRRIVIPTVLPAGVMAFLLYLVESTAEPESIIELLALAGLGLAVFAGLYVMLGASRPERDLVRGLAAGTFRIAQGYVRRAE